MLSFCDEAHGYLSCISLNGNVCGIFFPHLFPNSICAKQFKSEYQFFIHISRLSQEFSNKTAALHESKDEI